MPDGTVAIHPFAEQARVAAAAAAPARWLSALRRDAAERYAARGLPGRRDEYWRYTNLNALAKREFAQTDPQMPVALDTLPDLVGTGLDGYLIVLVNGHLRTDLCAFDGLPDGVRLDSLGDMLVRAPQQLEPWLGKIAGLDGMPLASLNTAFLDDGMALFVDAGVDLDRPIHLVSIGAAGTERVAFQPRNLVVLGDGAAATLIEHHLAAADDAEYFSNIVTEIAIGEAARLNHYKMQCDATAAFHLALTEARLARGASYRSFVLQTGAAIGRHEVRVRLDGSDADCALGGVYLIRDGQLLDNTTLVEHAAPSGRSRQMYNGVLDGKSRGVFQGKIHVRRDAQQTDGHQLSRALLLSPNAEIDIRPELEIYADDVKCSHGATAGDLDEDALFYLLSRGIERGAARRLLVGAFVADALGQIADARIAEAFGAHIRGWLDSHVGALPDGGDDTP